MDLGAGDDGGADGAEASDGGGVERGEGAAEVGLAGDRFLERAMLLVQMQGVVVVFGGFATGDEKRKGVGEKLARHAQRVRHVAGGVVVAGEEAPEAIVDDDRQRKGGEHAHVLEVFDVNRRHGARDTVAHVERLAGVGAKRWLDGDGRVAEVGNEAEFRAFEEFARLFRDVGGGVVEAEEGFEVVAFGFGDDVAGEIFGEAIDHHAIEADEVADVFGGELAEIDDGEIAVERGEGVFQRGENLLMMQCGAIGPVLEFEDEGALVAMDDGLGRTWSAREVEGREVLRDGVERERKDAGLEVGEIFGGDEAGEGSAEEFGVSEAEFFGGVEARLNDREIGLAEHEHRGVRLDRAGNVDGFAIAVREIDGLGCHRFSH